MKTYVINFDAYKSVRTHLISMYINDISVTLFDRCWVECILRERFQNLLKIKISEQISIKYKPL